MELDIWYVEGQFILNHGKPSENINKYDKLEKLFKKFGNKIEYWLDFKNLDEENIKEAIKKLKLNIDQSEINYEKIFSCLIKQQSFSSRF